jgi:hypothetical protein
MQKAKDMTVKSAKRAPRAATKVVRAAVVIREADDKNMIILKKKSVTEH